MAKKVAIVTGGASGLGAAIVRLFIEEGAEVVAADVVSARAAGAVVDLGARYVRTDVTDDGDVDRLVESVLADAGRLDVMCNNAGVIAQSPIAETSSTDFLKMTAVNFGGAFRGTRAAARVMVRQRGGTIVNTASNGGSSPTAGMSVYSGTKAAIIAMSKSAAIELAPHGVRVNTVSPGTMLTGMVPDDDGVRESLNGLQPIGYAADPAQMAAGVLYLASDEADYVTGHDLVIDGGATAGRPRV